MRKKLWPIPASAVLAASVACGGSLLEQPTEDAGAAADALAPDDATTGLDTGTRPDDAPVLLDGPALTCGVSWATLLAVFPQPPWDGGYLFMRLADMLAFFRTMARLDSFVDPASGVDCKNAPGSCEYDPTQSVPPDAALDPYYVNGLGEFIAPNGLPYILSYDAALNVWLVVDQTMSPQSYELLVELNSGCMAACPCDAGSE